MHIDELNILYYLCYTTYFILSNLCNNTITNQVRLRFLPRLKDSMILSWTFFDFVFFSGSRKVWSYMPFLYAFMAYWNGWRTFFIFLMDSWIIFSCLRNPLNIWNISFTNLYISLWQSSSFYSISSMLVALSAILFLFFLLFSSYYQVF